MLLRGKNALLTGGSRGLGPVIARALAARGVNLFITARSLPQLTAVADDLRHSGVRAVAMAADVSVAADREALVARAADELGAIDILINNAGVELVSRYQDLEPEVIARMVAVNLAAPLLLTRAILPDMLRRGSGHVVTMSSMGGKKGSPYSATYAATKAGLIAWSLALRTELSGSGVSTSVICPGFVSETGMFAVYRKRAPRIAGESSPRAVTDALVRAIEDDLAEVLVNPGPARLLAIADAVSPRLMSWILDRGGVYRFYREQAEENARTRGR